MVFNTRQIRRLQSAKKGGQLSPFSSFPFRLFESGSLYIVRMRSFEVFLLMQDLRMMKLNPDTNNKEYYNIYWQQINRIALFN